MLTPAEGRCDANDKSPGARDLFVCESVLSDSYVIWMLFGGQAFRLMMITVLVIVTGVGGCKEIGRFDQAYYYKWYIA